MDDVIFRAILAVYLNKENQFKVIQELTEPLTGGNTIKSGVLLRIREFIKKCISWEIVCSDDISPDAYEKRIAPRIVYGVRDILEANGIPCNG